MAQRRHFGSFKAAFEKATSKPGSERTAAWSKHCSAKRGPRGEHLLLLGCHSERVFETTLALADKDHVVADSNVQKICDEMTIAIGLMKRFLKHEKHSRSNQSVG